MNDIYVAYNSDFESGGEICAGEEDSDWPNYNPAYYGFELLGVFKQVHRGGFSQALFQSDLEVGQKAFVVVVRYGDGDTFSHNTGKGGIAGVFDTKEKAQTLVSSIEEDTFEGYKFWDDYFGGLESVYIETASVKESI